MPMIPYVRKAYQPSSRMADLVLAAGQQQAQAERERGERSAQLWSGLGNTVGRTMASVIEAQSEAPRRELQRVQTENAKLQGDQIRRDVKADTTAKAIMPFALMKRDDGVSTYDRDLLTKEFTTAGIADKLPDIFKGLDAADKAALDLTNAKREGLAGLAYGALVAGATPQAVKMALDHAISNRLLTKDEAVPYLQALEQDPERAKEIVTQVASLSPTFAGKLKPEVAKTREIKVLNPDGTETIQIVEDTPGQTFTSAARPEPAPKAGTLEDYIKSLAKDRKKPAETWSATEKAEAVAAWTRLTNPPKTSMVDPVKQKQIADKVTAVMANPSLYDDLTPSDKGEIMVDLAKAGFSGFGRRLSDATITKMAESRSAMASLKDLRQVLQDNEQYIGPIAGYQALNPWSEARQAQSKIDLVRQRVGKALEGGVLRKEDEEKYKKILATLTDEPRTAIFKVDSLLSTLESDLENFIDENRRAGRRVTEPAKADEKKPAATSGPQVGTILNKGGKSFKVTKVYPNGRFDADEVKK